MAYDVGAFNFPTLAFRQSMVEVYESIARKSDAAYTTDWHRWGFFGIGVALMALVQIARQRFTGFWLHPVGLTYTSTFTADVTMINVLLAWIAKASMDMLGGARLVNRARPFFLGMLCGHALGVALGVLVDAIWFPGQGHQVLTVANI